MKRALISTIYNEADNLSRWWDSILHQTVLPDEIAIVDGGSTDGTWEKLQELARSSPVPVRLKQERCNIAGGRNRAIALTDAEIIAASDAGSFPQPDWFGEITRPLLENEKLDVVAAILKICLRMNSKNFSNNLKASPLRRRVRRKPIRRRATWRFAARRGLPSAAIPNGSR